MSTCSRCGNPIEFRYVNGRCVPLHLSGGCIGDGNSRVNDYSGYNFSENSTCFSTNCPKCGDEVFFIRHNGGSVWIDPPLGPPWYKHACFDAPSVSDSKPSLVSSYKIPINEAEEFSSSDLIIGIVKSTCVDSSETFTDTVLETGKSERIEIEIKNKAGFLLGRICIYDKKSGTIWSLEEPSYMFTVYKRVRNRKNKQVACPKCMSQYYYWHY